MSNAVQPLDLDKLEALARAATRGPWRRSDRPNGLFWQISSEYTIGGEPCKSGRQSIGSIHAENKRGAPKYAAMFEANASFVAEFNPATALTLITLARRAAPDSAAQPLDLDSLTRYDNSGFDGVGNCMEADKFGDYVKLSDVLALIAQARTARTSGTLNLDTTAKLSIDERTTAYHQGYQAGIEMGKALAADEGAADTTASGSIDTPKLRPVQPYTVGELLDLYDNCKGDWCYNGKPATAAKIGKQLREAAKDEFEYLAARITVRPHKPAGAPAAQPTKSDKLA